MRKHLRIGTRGSKLALAQSQWVRTRIEAEHSGVEVELVKIKTTGDKVLDSPLARIGGKGLFVKEIEEALLSREVDLAVHSMKDVPAELPAGLTLLVFPEREDPRDAMISLRYPALDLLPERARVGTGSLRRIAQLLHMRPDLEAVPVRGNVDTRLRKLEDGEFEALVLASAGLRRLGLSKRIAQPIPVDLIIPAIGQGALGLETREGDKDTGELLSFLNHPETEISVRAERAFLRELEGGCQVPLAAFCRIEGKRILMTGMVAEVDGSRIIKDAVEGEPDRAEETGISLARRLLRAGAGEILAHIYQEELPLNHP